MLLKGGSWSWEKQGMDLIHGLSLAPGLARMDQRIWSGGDNDPEGKGPGFPVEKGHHHLNIKLMEFLRLEKTIQGHH